MVMVQTHKGNLKQRSDLCASVYKQIKSQRSVFLPFSLVIKQIAQYLCDLDLNWSDLRFVQTKHSG